MVAITVWILELLLMGALAWLEPQALIHDNMIGGMVFAVAAWIPAIMAQAMFER
jgi:hypothetical protein